MNITNKTLIELYERGYRIIDGEVYNSKGNKLKGCISNCGYRFFSHTIGKRPNRRTIKIQYHRLLAYQKYGNSLFEEGIEVRHLNGNSLNNSNNNVVIGTHYQNMMDKPIEQRRMDAGNHGRKYLHAKIIEYYNKTKSYKKVMEKFGMSSKGAVSYIIKKSLNSQGLI